MSRRFAKGLALVCLASFAALGCGGALTAPRPDASCDVVGAPVVLVTKAEGLTPPSLEEAAQLHARGDGIFHEGKYVYHGASSGLKIFKKDRKGRLLLKSVVYLPGSVHDIHVHKNMAYVACGAPGLFVIDVSQKDAPKVLWQVRFRGATHRLHHRDGLLAVSLGTMGLVILEVSRGERPEVLGDYQGEDLVRHGILVDDLAFVAETRRGVTLLKHDSGLGVYFNAQFETDGQARALAFGDGYLYVADGTGGLKIFEVYPEALTMKLVGAYPTSDIARDVWVDKHRLMVAIGDDGVLIFDISHPAKPILEGQWASSKPVNRVRSKGGVLYLGNDSAGLVIIDVSNPGAPKQLHPGKRD